MGVCECVDRDGPSANNVDINNLKKDLSIIENNLRAIPANPKENNEEVFMFGGVENSQIKEGIEPQLQKQISEHSNVPEEINQPIVIQQRQQTVNKNKLSSQMHKGEIRDSRIDFSKRTVSRFLNRNYINIVISGSKGVGKSAFVIKFIENVFEKLYIPTLGSEVRSKKFTYNNHEYILNFTVTSGNDYKIDYSNAYESVDFFLVFYDITSMESFEEAKKILKSDIKSYLCSYDQTMTNVFLVGNKIDFTPRNVPEQLAKTFCQKNEFQMFDISVKTNKNITTMMKALIKTVDDIAYPI